MERSTGVGWFTYVIISSNVAHSFSPFHACAHCSLSPWRWRRSFHKSSTIVFPNRNRHLLLVVSCHALRLYTSLIVVAVTSCRHAHIYKLCHPFTPSRLIFMYKFFAGKDGEGGLFFFKGGRSVRAKPLRDCFSWYIGV